MTIPTPAVTSLAAVPSLVALTIGTWRLPILTLPLLGLVVAVFGSEVADNTKAPRAGTIRGISNLIYLAMVIIATIGGVI